MNPWILFALVGAVCIYFLDYLLRRKKPKENTKLENVSLLVNMFSIGPHLFLSAIALFWGVTGCGSVTAFGKVLYDVTIVMAGIYFFIALAAAISSLILRKAGKLKASIWVNIIAFAYIIIVLAINYLAGEVL